LVEDRDLVREITEAVSGIEESLNGEFRQKVGSLLPAFSLFGYPGLSDPHLVTETTLDVRKLLKNHTQVRYAGVNGQTLPETYNGLGARNLIYILLQLYGFFKSFAVDSSAPCVHLIFLEEPEAHLHPQMQQVFVRQIEQLTREFAKRRTDIHSWPVQFVLTTHSPHMANEASFDRLRYFASEVNVDGQRSTRVKDLGHGLGGTPRADRDFLHQYLTLTRCDLLFADKAILIEGTSERLLLPRMSQMIDDDPHPISPLARQYITVMEVGGAYAHRFFGLLDFLGLKTLVITDLDAVNAKGEKCQPAEGTGTSNACIKSWFADSVIDIPALLGKSESDKVKGVRRLAYQIPEVAGGACGRSLEEAFVIANPDLFEIANSGDALEARAGEVAKRANKTAFAIKHAIDVVEWSVPLYIAEGLRWLARTHLPGNVLPQMPQMRQSSPVETADPLGSAVQ
jgi:hypothetical protein